SLVPALPLPARLPRLSLSLDCHIVRGSFWWAAEQIRTIAAKAHAKLCVVSYTHQKPCASTHSDIVRSCHLRSARGQMTCATALATPQEPRRLIKMSLHGPDRITRKKCTACLCGDLQ